MDSLALHVTSLIENQFDFNEKYIYTRKQIFKIGILKMLLQMNIIKSL